MERERMTLAMQDRPLRSELESLNELNERRLKATEAEIRRHTMEVSTRLQVWSYLIGVASSGDMGPVDITRNHSAAKEGVAMIVHKNGLQSETMPSCPCHKHITQERRIRGDINQPLKCCTPYLL